MLWQIESGDLDTIIEATPDNLNEKILEAIETKKPDGLSLLIHIRRLTDWDDRTTIKQILDADLFLSTQGLMVSFNKWWD